MLTSHFPCSPALPSILQTPQVNVGLSHLMLPPIINPGLRGDTLENASALSPHLVQPPMDLPQMSKVRGVDALLSDSGQDPIGARPRTANVSPRIVRNALRLAGVEGSQHHYPATHAALALEETPYVADLESGRFSFESEGRAHNRPQPSVDPRNERYDPRRHGSSWSPPQNQYPANISDHHETMSAPSTADRDHRPGGRLGQFPYELIHPDSSSMYRQTLTGKDRADSTYHISPPEDMERHRPRTSHENTYVRGRHEAADLQAIGRGFSPSRQSTSYNLPMLEAPIHVPAPTNQMPVPHIPPYSTPNLAPFSFPGDPDVTIVAPPLSDLEQRCEDVSLDYGTDFLHLSNHYASSRLQSAVRGF
jgi:hypothetical protein